jgi:hypothetical protein
MGEQDGFELRGGNLKPTNLDKLLLSVDNIPFACSFVTIPYVAGFKIAFLVIAFGIGFRVLKITRNDGRSSDADFTADSVG